MKTVIQLRQERNDLLAKAKELIDVAEKESRSLNTQEKKQYDDLVVKIDNIADQINNSEELRNKKIDAVLKLHENNFDAVWNDQNRSIGIMAGNRAYGGIERTETGDKIIVLRNHERLSDIYTTPDDERLSLGKYVRGLVTGNWKEAENEKRAMTVSTLSAGGYLVPTPLSAQLIDVARNMAVCFKAGALTIPMESSTLTIAKQLTDSTSSWKAEAAALTPSDLTFGSVVLTARTLMSICKMSIELFEDAQNIDDVVMNAISNSLALELDRAALRGDGSGASPKGILNQTGIQTYSMGANGAAPTNYDPFSQAVQLIQQVNGNPNASVFAPRTAGELDRLKDSQLRPLIPPNSFANLQKFVSNQVPINLTQGTSVGVASEAYVGDFTKLLIGLRTNVTLEISRETNDAFTNGLVYIRAYLRADVALSLANQFCVIQGLL